MNEISDKAKMLVRDLIDKVTSIQTEAEHGTLTSYEEANREAISAELDLLTYITELENR